MALAGDAVLVALSVLWPVVLTRYPHPAPVLVLGVVAHLACATAGTAVGLLCARPVVARIGWSVCLAVAIVVPTAVTPWLPPVGTAVRALVTDGPAPVLDAGICLVLAVVVAGIAWAVDLRR